MTADESAELAALRAERDRRKEAARAAGLASGQARRQERDYNAARARACVAAWVRNGYGLTDAVDGVSRAQGWSRRSIWAWLRLVR
jgi:hypothetical protein